MDNSTQKERPARHWHQFGLRAIFVAITLVACLAAWLGSEIARQRQEETAITTLIGRNSDGSTTTIWESRFNEIPSADINPLNPPRQRLQNIELFRRVAMFSSFPRGNSFAFGADDQGRLVITREYKSGLKDVDMQQVKKFADLRSLWLEANEITDAGLLQLSNLKHLEILWLQHTAITDKGLSVLASLPELRDIDLSGTYVSDVSVRSLAKCQRLMHLKLRNTSVTSSGIANLQRALPDCRIER